MNLKDYITKERFSILRKIILTIIISTLVVTLFSFYSNKKIDERVAARQFIYEFGRTLGTIFIQQRLSKTEW